MKWEEIKGVSKTSWGF